jgi:hypothetical protein
MLKKRVSGITVLAAVILFSMTACSDGGGGGGSRGSFNPGNPSGPDNPSIPGNPITPPVEPPDYPDPGTQTPVVSDYEIRNVFQYEGNVTAVTITPLAGKSTGAITIYYDGSTTLPTAVGTYTVTFDVAAASGWNAAPGLAGGTLTINSQDQPEYQYPVAADYIISGTGTYTYDGTSRTVTITPLAGKSTGAITIYYSWSTTLPSAAGTYTVTFNVAAASGWNAAVGLAGGTLTITKAPGATAGVPALNSKTKNSITINAVAAPSTGQSVEYGISTSNNASTAEWRTALTFSGLSAGTTFYIFARAVGNRNYETGAASGGLAVTTIAAGATVGVPTLNTRTHNSITINAVAAPGNGQSVEYGITTSNYAYYIDVWQTALTFSGLNAGTTYYIFARAAGNSNYETGAASGSLAVTTTVNKAAGATVGAPALNTRTHNSITINAVAAPATGQSVEYGISTSNNANNAVWQAALTFNGLSAGTTYYIFARSVGNSNYETGAASASLAVTTLQAVSPGRIEYYWVDQHGSLVTTSGGATTIARGATLTITAQGTGYAVKQWHLNGMNTGQSGNTYNFSSTAAGKHTVGLFVEKGGKLYSTNITITVY